MARCPFAVWKPVTADKLAGPGLRPRLRFHYRISLHVTGDHKDTQHPYFNQSGIPDSHFHVDYAGEIEQYVDTDEQAFADLEGNDATVSIETTGDASSQWTTEQLAAIVRLIAWLYQTHPYNPGTGDGFPLKLADNAHLGWSSKGLAWHRLGIDGNFPALPSIQAGRLQRGGGMHWSTARGKVCPGDRRIEQIPGILARAIELINGPTPTPAPTPVPDVQEDDMILIRNASNGRVYLVSGGRATYLTDSKDLGALLRAGVKQVDVTNSLASAIAKWA